MVDQEDHELMSEQSYGATTDTELEAGEEPVSTRRVIPVLGFFTGVAYLFVVPGLIIGVFGTVTPEDWESAFNPYAFLSLLGPVVLLVPERTRHFAMYMLAGMIAGLVLVVSLTVAFLLLVSINEGGF